MRKEIMKLWYDAPDANSGFDAILEFIEAHTHSKLKAFAGEVEQAIEKLGTDVNINNHSNTVLTVGELRQSLKAIKKKAGIE